MIFPSLKSLLTAQNWVIFPQKKSVQVGYPTCNSYMYIYFYCWNIYILPVSCIYFAHMKQADNNTNKCQRIFHTHALLYRKKYLNIKSELMSFFSISLSTSITKIQSSLQIIHVSIYRFLISSLAFLLFFYAFK